MSKPSNAVVVRTGVKGGLMSTNHGQAVVVRTGVKGGLVSTNHGQAVVVRTGVKCGFRILLNHAQALV